MVRYVIALIAFFVVAAGLLWPAFQPARESGCPPRGRSVGQLQQESASGMGDAAAVVASEQSQDAISMPNEVAGLLDRLNEWHADELLLYNEPELFPELSVPSGETGGWIASHIELIKALGADVEWDKQRKKYVVVSEVLEE